ncbi:putative reverse transcriptase domain-containing protein [Tanacetum coccineum]|uniref:Reverse transcriptase domain-containing protein n=1 Tax=Tanacetum coccineum TaxID=301880 RepID=A0ABQ5BV48_9ASTR
MTTPSPSPPISLSPPSAGERLVRSMAPPAHSSPPPMPSPLLPSSGCPTQIQTLRIASTQALIDAVIAALPSPPLPQLPPSLYILPPVNCRDDIPESEPTKGRGIDYGFVSTVDAKERRQGIRDVGYGDSMDGGGGGICFLRGLGSLDRIESGDSEAVDQFDSVPALTMYGRLKVGEIKKLEIELWNLKVKGNDVPAYNECFQELTLICTKFVTNETEKVDKYISGLPDNIYGNVKSARPKTLDETIELANDLMDQKLCTYAERQSDNKRKADDSSRNNDGERKPNGGSLPKGTGNINVANTQKGNGAAPKGNVGNVEKRGNASGNPDANVVMGTFLLNNHYASILFNNSADRSFISTAFSSLINIALTPLENCYDVELADGKLVGIDTIIRGCTLNLLDHPFNIDLMPVELGSFDVIVGMDWFRRCHTVIVYDEKLVQVHYRNETLNFYGNESSNGRESRLTVISYSKAQEYMAKGCQVFLAQISAKKEEDTSEGKQIKDVPIVRDFPEVFLEDLPGLPPA